MRKHLEQVKNKLQTRQKQYAPAMIDPPAYNKGAQHPATMRLHVCRIYSLYSSVQIVRATERQE
jgi:hypothetical protein